MLKSHDCHVFMQRLLSIALSDLVPKPIWGALTELSIFFGIYALLLYKLSTWQNWRKSIIITICKLEKIFPPSFFDSMEHLPIHLAYEARVGGPAQYRWMYTFERTMHYLKKKVNSRGRVDGSICEAYIIE